MSAATNAWNQLLLEKLIADYAGLESLLIRTESNLRMICENKRISMENSYELDVINMRLDFRSKNDEIETVKTTLFEKYKEAYKNKDPLAKDMKLEYDRVHTLYLDQLANQKTLIANAEKRNALKIKSVIDIMTKRQYEHGTPMFELLYKRKEALVKLEKHRLLMAEEKRKKTVSKAVFESPMKDVCGICLEPHIIKDTILTSCKHQFGTECFKRWVHTCESSHKVIWCPMCKNNRPKTAGFREKEVKVKEVIKIRRKPVRGSGAIGDAAWLLAMSHYNPTI